MKQPKADVAELADAQVSEACDGDIVEVQVLSSAPGFIDEPDHQALFLCPTEQIRRKLRIKQPENICHGSFGAGVFSVEVDRKG